MSNDTSSTEDTCDDCGKKLEDCPLWQQVEESMKEIKKGHYRHFTLEEYLKYLEEPDEWD